MLQQELEHKIESRHRRANDEVSISEVWASMYPILKVILLSVL